MTSALSISVVVVNWNSKDDLRDCLVSLDGQTERNFETIVVDNGSTDGSLEVLAADFPWVVVVDTGENLGFAEGCNRGIEKASGTWIAMLNNDAVASPDWIASLRRAAEQGDSRLGMVQSRILFKHDPRTTNSTGVLIYRGGKFVDRGFNHPVLSGEVAEEIFCVTAGAALYARTMLEDVRLESGFFDRTFFMYYEDVDLGWRGRLGGWSAVYDPRATVYHAFHGSSGRRSQHFVQLQCAKNRLRTVLKNASLPYVARSSMRVLGDVVWAVAKEGPRALVAYWSALTDGLSQRKAVTRMMRRDRRSVEQRWVVKSRERRTTKGSNPPMAKAAEATKANDRLAGSHGSS